jgi:hypothetical protein
MGTNMTEANTPQPILPEDGGTLSRNAATTVVLVVLSLLPVGGWVFTGLYFLRHWHAVCALKAEREQFDAALHADRKVHAQLRDKADKHLHGAESDALKATADLRRVQLDRETLVQTLARREKELADLQAECVLLKQEKQKLAEKLDRPRP